jgi:hypothetical protein
LRYVSIDLLGRQAARQKSSINSRYAAQNDPDWFSLVFCQQSIFIKVLIAENEI